MSYGPLPLRVDPRKLAEREAELHGTVELQQMPNFSSLLVDSEGVVEVALQFSVDEQKLRTLTGTAKAEVNQTCQRCLEPVPIQLNAEFNLAVVLNEDQAKNLPRVYDPLLVEGELILASVVEEELILSLPAVAYHADCSVTTSYGEEAIESSEGQAEKENPFSVLAQLKTKR